MTLNGKEIEEMPDLLDRLKALDKADMTTIMGKKTITEKEREDQISWSDVYNLNYTLRYSEPTAVMTQLNNSSNYSAGNTVYSNNYASAGTSTSSSSTSSSSSSNTTFTSAKTRTGSDVWTAIATLVENHISVSKGKKNQYITRLYKADAKWDNIHKILKGHNIKGNGMWNSSNGMNLAIRTLLYLKQPEHKNWTLKKAYEKAILDEKAAHGDWGAALNSALTWW